MDGLIWFLEFVVSDIPTVACVLIYGGTMICLGALVAWAFKREDFGVDTVDDD